MKKIFLNSSVLVMAALSSPVSAANYTFQPPFYAGISGGYGSTTWRGLVPINEKEGAVLTISTPVEVKEGGGAWGVFLGYEFTPYFALEGAYKKYPNATVIFEEDSLFAFEHSDELSFHTSTDTVSLMAKIMMVIPDSTVRIFSSAGIAGVHRLDEDVEYLMAAPTFSAGFNVSFTNRFMMEFGVNYTSGYGESEISPAKHYIPFLYSGMINLAYRF